MHTLYNHPENHKESRSPSPSFSTRATMVCLGVTIVNQVLLPVDRPEVGSRLEIGHCTFECPIYIFQITLDIQNQNYHKRAAEVRGKGSSGPVFGLNAMCQAELGQLDPKRDHGLAHGRPGTVQSGFGLFLPPGRNWWTSDVREKGSSGTVFGLNAMCQAGVGQLDPKRDHGLAHGRPGTVQSGFGRFVGPGRTWWTSEIRGKGYSGTVFGLNAMCQARLRQLDPKRDHALAHRRPGTVQGGFGRFLPPEGTWWTSEVRGKGYSGPVFGLNAMCQAGQGQN